MKSEGKDWDYEGAFGHEHRTGLPWRITGFRDNVPPIKKPPEENDFSRGLFHRMNQRFRLIVSDALFLFVVPSVPSSYLVSSLQKQK